MSYYGNYFLGIKLSVCLVDSTRTGYKKLALDKEAHEVKVLNQYQEVKIKLEAILIAKIRIIVARTWCAD